MKSPHSFSPFIASLVTLLILLPVICGQDIPPPHPDEFNDSSPVETSPPSPPPPSSTAVPAVTTSFSKEPEETTPKATSDPPLGPPNFNKNLFKWTQYRQFRNGLCLTCGCFQYKHYRDTCECFNYFIHAKANLIRGMYIKQSPWTLCKVENPMVPPLRKVDCVQRRI